MSMLDQVLQVAPLAIRVLTIGAGCLSSLGGILNILSPHLYTIFAVSLWSTALGMASIICETSPEGFSYLLKLFPFLEAYQSRGTAYAAVGILTLGREFGVLARTAGYLFLLSAAGHILLGYLAPHTFAASSSSSNRIFHPSSMGYRDLSATGSREEFQHMTNETQQEASPAYPHV